MKTDHDIKNEEPVSSANAERNDLPMGSSRVRRAVGASVPPGPKSAAKGAHSMPAELTDFVRSCTVSEVASALQVDRRTVQRLRNGYWPVDSRKLRAAWSAYKGRTGITAKRWVLRCVYPGGLLRQGRHAYTAQQLGARVGELLAVARSVDGALIAQPLQPPMERFALQRLEA